VLGKQNNDVLFLKIDIGCSLLVSFLT
jgi:hypothetical protein